MNNNIKDKIMSYIIFKPKKEDELLKALDMLRASYKDCIEKYGLVKDWDLSEMEPYVYIDFFDHGYNC